MISLSQYILMIINIQTICRRNNKLIIQSTYGFLVFGVGGSSVNRGGVCGSGVSGSLVSGSWFVVFLDVFGVFGLSLELDISGVSILVSSVGHNLGAAIGESNAVGSGDDVVVGFLVVLEIVVRFLILNVVSEAVRLGSLFLNDENFQLDLYSFLIFFIK